MLALGVFLVRTFPHSDWIRTDTKYLSIISQYSDRMRENVGQNNSEFGHFLRRAFYILLFPVNTDF